MGKNVTVKIEGVQAHGEVGTVKWTQVREYWEKHTVLLFVVILVTLSSPFLGLFLAGWVGVCVGLVIGLVTFFVSLRAITRVREVTHGQ